MCFSLTTDLLAADICYYILAICRSVEHASVACLGLMLSTDVVNCALEPSVELGLRCVGIILFARSPVWAAYQQHSQAGENRLKVFPVTYTNFVECLVAQLLGIFVLIGSCIQTAEQSLNSCLWVQRNQETVGCASGCHC